MPRGFVVTGDAACAFNPVYGQGITTAALGALALGRCVDRSSHDRLPSKFQRELARVIRHPWMLATGEDLRYRSVEGARRRLSDRLMHGYLDRVVELGTWDARERLALPGVLF